MTQTNRLEPIAQLAEGLSKACAPEAVWQRVDHALQSLYGHGLFTILAYDRDAGLLKRIYSSRPDINPVGGMKRVTQSPWVDRVLVRAEGYIGSSADDIRSVFSDHALLIEHGLESVQNISVSDSATVVGSLNLLHGPTAYDGVDLRPARIVAQLIAPMLARIAAELSTSLPPSAALETV